MRRVKRKQLIVAFETTTAAMAFEQAATAQGIEGRLIPLPSEISAGCGLAWRTEPEKKTALVSWASRHGLHWEAMHELEQYVYEDIDHGFG